MRRLRRATLNWTVTAAFLLSVVLFAGLQLRWMGPGDTPEALAAYAMPDGTLPQLCDGSDGHHPPSPGQPHCPACLVAASPGLLAPPLVVVGTTAAPGMRLGLPAVDPPAAAPPWRPRLARAPPASAFA